MRASRLLGLMMELSRRGPTTLPDLAARFDVSERTIQRDLAALADLGVPLWTRTGPAGGVGLVEGWRSPITGMTAAELRALMLGPASAADLGLDEDYATARLKVLTAPAGTGAAAALAGDRLLVDSHAWFQEAAQRPEWLLTVAEAIWADRRVVVGYQRRPDAPVRQRTLDPLGLVVKASRWYLVASRRESVRTYRVERLRAVRILDEPAAMPDGFSLADYWQESQAQFEAQLNAIDVRLSIPGASREELTLNVPGAATVAALETAESQGDRLAMRLPMESIEIAASQLMAVTGVQVEQPAELRRLIAVRATELAELNS